MPSSSPSRADGCNSIPHRCRRISDPMPRKLTSRSEVRAVTTTAVAVTADPCLQLFAGDGVGELLGILDEEQVRGDARRRAVRTDYRKFVVVGPIRQRRFHGRGDRDAQPAAERLSCDQHGGRRPAAAVRASYQEPGVRAEQGIARNRGIVTAEAEQAIQPVQLPTRSVEQLGRGHGMGSGHMPNGRWVVDRRLCHSPGVQRVPLGTGRYVLGEHCKLNLHALVCGDHTARCLLGRYRRTIEPGQRVVSVVGERQQQLAPDRRAQADAQGTPIAGYQQGEPGRRPLAEQLDECVRGLSSVHLIAECAEVLPAVQRDNYGRQCAARPAPFGVGGHAEFSQLLLSKLALGRKPGDQPTDSGRFRARPPPHRSAATVGAVVTQPRRSR